MKMFIPTLLGLAVLIECCGAMGSLQHSIPNNIIANLQRLSHDPLSRLNHLVNSPDSRVAESMQLVLSDIDSMNLSLQDLKSTLALAVAVTWRMADDSKPLRLKPIRENIITTSAAATATHTTSMKLGRRHAVKTTMAMQTSNASIGAADPQADSLRCIYNSTAGDMWTNRGGWNSNSSICSWWGVWCNGTDVIVLNLGANNLRGSIESCFAALTSLYQLSVHRFNRHAWCAGT